MAQVTFTNNVDHYVKGDVRDLDRDELKRVDEYAKKWKIKDPYVKGQASQEQLDESETKTASKRPVKRSQPKVAARKSRSKAATAPAVDPNEQVSTSDAKSDEGTTTDDLAGEPDGVGERAGDKAASQDGNDQGGDAGSEPATDEGSQPNVVEK